MVNKDIATAVRDGLGELLWRQWRSMGVPAASPPSHVLIDPDALLLETADWTARYGDDRLRDGAISWAVRHHALIATHRLKRLVRLAEPQSERAFMIFARQVADTAGRISWPMDEVSPEWTPSTDVRLPLLDSTPSLLRLRARGMFGSNARAEAVAFLACTSGAVDLAVIERDTQFSRTQIADALDGLVKANWVRRLMVGNSLRFELSEFAREELSVPIRDIRIGPREMDRIRSSAGPSWVDWPARYQLLRILSESADRVGRCDVVGSLAALRGKQVEFRNESLTVPDALGRGETDPVALERIREWIEQGFARLAGFRLATASSDDVSVALDRFAPEPTGWFQEGVTYVGRGEARFETNPGTVRGPATVRFNPDGSLDEFSIEVEELDAAIVPGGGIEHGLFAFISGLPVEGDASSFSIGGHGNRCVSVVVRGEDFELSVDQDEIIASAGNGTVRFHPYRTIARYDTQAISRYWAVPLVNFVSPFWWYLTSLHRHPLRMRRSAALDTSRPPTAFEEVAYRQSNAIIPFEVEGEPGFIEPFPDYDRRVERLDIDRVAVTTAMMVGNVRSEAASDEWFPSDLVSLLSLASGRGIAGSHVELRGNNGELVGRLHTRFGSSQFRQDTQLVDESLNRSTGRLITKFLASPYCGSIFMRVAMKHLQRSLSADSSIDQRVDHACRLAECLAVGVGLDTVKSVELSSSTVRSIDEALSECTAALHRISGEESSLGGKVVAEMLRSINEMKSPKPPYDELLLKLLDHLGLPDASWLREFSFSVDNSGGPTEWASAARKLRNRVVHLGFIDFQDEFDLHNTVAFLQHFSDVLVRAIFALIDFDGPYRPVSGWDGMRLNHEMTDWPQPSKLSGRALGYRQSKSNLRRITP